MAQAAALDKSVEDLDLRLFEIQPGFGCPFFSEKMLFSYRMF